MCWEDAEKKDMNNSRYQVTEYEVEQVLLHFHTKLL